jgi:hypothetical protein
MLKIVLFLAILLLIKPLNAEDVFIDKNSSPLTVGLVGQNSDNFNPTLSDGKGASSLLFSGAGKLVSINDSLWLQADYSAQYQSVNLDKNDQTQSEQYLTANAELLARLYIQPALYIDGSFEYIQQDEMFGTGISKLRNNILLADEKKQSTAALGFTYGGETASRSISLTYKQADTQYSEINFYSNLFSFLQKTLTLNIKFKLSDNTRFIALLENQQDDYDDQSRDDSSKQRVLLGIDWRPSGSSELSLLFGKYLRKPDLAEKTTGLTWQLLYKYQPRDDFQIRISSAQSSIVGESALSSDSVLQQWQFAASYLYTVQWSYFFNANYDDTSYKEPILDRSLKETLVSVGASFNIRKYHRIKFLLTRRNVKESNGVIDYQQNEVGLHWLYEF